MGQQIKLGNDEFKLLTPFNTGSVQYFKLLKWLKMNGSELELPPSGSMWYCTKSYKLFFPFLLQESMNFISFFEILYLKI